MLTETAAAKARPREKRYALSDIRGLRLEIMPSGRKLWRARITRDGRRSWQTLGEYPNVSIDEAREQAERLRLDLKAARVAEASPEDEPADAPEAAPDMTFAAIAMRWADYNDTRPIVDNSKRKDRSLLARIIIPALGEMDIREIEAPDILRILQMAADAGQFALVTHIKATISHIFQYAGIRGIVMHDPTAMLRGAILPPPVSHYRSLRNPAEVGKLLRAVNAYPGKLARLATFFLMYSFCRPGEMRFAEWSEIDTKRGEWTIPAEKMKKRRIHVVPLSRQLREILDAMRPANGRYIFAGARGNGEKPMHRDAVLKLLARIGYSKSVTPHGFRSTASTILNENKFNSDWIEMQLAHVEESSIRGIYNHAEFMPQRRRMVAWYSDYLDELRGEPMNMMEG